MDDDFQPAGSIGPEIELRFDSPEDPFDETFAEEEVVIDRYASLEADVFADRPMVSSSESRELGQMLDPWVVPSAEKKLGIAPSPEPVPVKMTPQPVKSAPPPAEKTSPAAAALRGFTAAETPVHPAASIPAASDRSEGDADLIIIEEDPPAPAPQRPTPPLVRRQEYRQLFAKLRHG